MVFFFAFSSTLLLGWWVHRVSWPARSSGTHPWSAFRRKYTESVTVEGPLFDYMEILHPGSAFWRAALSPVFLLVLLCREGQR